MKNTKLTRPLIKLAALTAALVPLSTTNAGFVGYNPTDNVGYGMLAQASYWNWTGQTFANGWTMARYSGIDSYECEWQLWGLDGGSNYGDGDIVTDDYVLAEYYWSGYFYYGSSYVDKRGTGDYAWAEVY